MDPSRRGARRGHRPRAVRGGDRVSPRAVPGLQPTRGRRAAARREGRFATVGPRAAPPHGQRRRGLGVAGAVRGVGAMGRRRPREPHVLSDARRCSVRRTTTPRGSPRSGPCSTRPRCSSRRWTTSPTKARSSSTARACTRWRTSSTTSDWRSARTVIGRDEFEDVLHDMKEDGFSVRPVDEAFARFTEKRAKYATAARRDRGPAGRAPRAMDRRPLVPRGANGALSAGGSPSAAFLCLCSNPRSRERRRRSRCGSRTRLR